MDKVLRKAGIEEKYFHTGEVIMNYVAGPPNGSPLVFIPGQSVTWEEYSLIIPRLADTFQIFAVSLRGHGKSSWTPGRYTYNQLGRDMTAFLKEVVGKPSIVAGNSSGGVLAAWLAANSPDLVRAVILEDPALFVSEWPAIKDTWAYDMFLGLSRMAVAGSGGYARFFREQLMTAAQDAGEVMDIKVPPKVIQKIISWWIAMKQAFAPGSPIDLAFLPKPVRILAKSTSQFDGNFSLAFVDGSVGEGFDHATALAMISQPILYLHANWFMHQGRLLGAQSDQHVEQVRSLVKGPFKYVRLDCGHAVALEAPVKEAGEILTWADEYSGRSH